MWKILKNQFSHYYTTRKRQMNVFFVSHLFFETVNNAPKTISN